MFYYGKFDQEDFDDYDDDEEEEFIYNEKRINGNTIPASKERKLHLPIVYIVVHTVTGNQ